MDLVLRQILAFKMVHDREKIRSINSGSREEMGDGSDQASTVGYAVKTSLNAQMSDEITRLSRLFQILEG